MRINGSRFERALDVTLLEELFLAVAVKLKRLKKSAFCWNYLAVRLLIKRGIDVQHVLGAIQSVKLSTSGLLYFLLIIIRIRLAACVFYRRLDMEASQWTGFRILCTATYTV